MASPSTSNDLYDLNDLNEFPLSKELKELGLLSIFKEFKEFQELSFYPILKDLTNLASLPLFKSYREGGGFKEKEPFKESAKLSSFLSYYKEFQLILCLECSLAIKPANYKGHLEKHFRGIGSKEKKGLIEKSLSILKGLEVSSLKGSYFLILLFSKLFPFSLYPFKELGLKKESYQCSSSQECSLILGNLYSIKRHIREEHPQALNIGYRVIPYF